MKKFLQLLFIILPSAALLMQCANPVMPTGGPRDTEPPRVVVSDPPNFSTNFSSRSIIITFNEFVNITKLQQQLLVSPPLDKKPEMRIRGRNLQLRFEEELKPETTYSVFFGDGITDLTEGNPLRDFTFVFSTGAIIDSMSISGNMLNAFDLEPVENAFVMLYLIDNDTLPLDSLPYLVKPYYVTRANVDGNFRFTNLRNEQFKIFGLADMNSNFIYDMAGEAIAFLDSLVRPAFFKPLADSLVLPDTLQFSDENGEIEIDESLLSIADSIRMVADWDRRHDKAYYELMMFKEVDSTQRLLRAELVKPGLLQFVFRYPARDVTVKPLDSIPENFGLLRQYNTSEDTLVWYFRQQLLDSLRIVIQLDTLIQDTLHLALNPQQTGRMAARQKDIQLSLQVSDNTRNRRLDVDKDLILSFDYPVVEVNLRDSIRFVALGDTTYNSIDFERIDSIGLRYRLNYSLEPEGTYSLLMPDSCFIGLNNTWNDTIRLAIRVPPLTEYGNLYIDIDLPPDQQFIIQLMNNRGVVIREKIIHVSQQLSFINLPPAQYILKAIHDRNRNGRWNTGDYLKGTQPERVIFFPKEMEIRANWDFEESWDIGEIF
jgi:hypothetical protein